MQKLCVFVVVCIIASVAHSQSKVEKYFQVTMKLKNDLSDVTVTHLSLSESSGLSNLKDSSEAKRLRTVNTLTTQADVLSYMAKLGWHSAGINYIGYAWVVMYFKKDFNDSELINP